MSTVTTAAPAATPNSTPQTAPQTEAPKTAPLENGAPQTASEQAAVNQSKEALKKWKIKVDKQEIELDEPELIRRAQMSTAAEKRFQEGATARKQAEQLWEMLKTDFTKVIDDPRLGLDPKAKREALERYYKQNYIDPEIMTPEQRRIAELENERKTWQQKEQERLQKEEQEKSQQIERYHAEQYQKMFIDALSKGGLPNEGPAGAACVRRMADLMAKNVAMGLDLTPDHLAQLVREDYVGEHKSLYSNLEGDALLSLMGEEVVNKIRKADLARLKAGIPTVPKTPIDTAKADQKPAGKQWLTMDEMREQRERRVKELSQK